RVQRDTRTCLGQPVLLRKINRLSKLVSTLQLLPILPVSYSKEECSSVSETSTPRIPVRIRKPARYPLIFLQLSQYSVDRLPLRRNNPNLNRPLLDREHLWSQNRRIRNPQQLPRVLLHIIPSNDDEPGAVRGPV